MFEEGGMAALTRRALLGASAALLLTGPALADGWPSETIRLIVPYATGGGTDALTRFLANQLEQQLGVPVIVENQPGAGSTLATLRLMKVDDPDHVFLMASPGFSVGPSIYPNVDYDPANDFSFVRMVTVNPNVIVVGEGSPIHNFDELMEAINTGGVTYASPGVGTSNHMAGVLFQMQTGTTLSHVPMDGSGPAMTSVIAGDVVMNFEGVTAAMPFIESGQLRPLAVTSADRYSKLPDVPTVQELGAEHGLESFVSGSWYGLIGNVDASEEALGGMRDAVTTAMETSAFEEYLDARGAMAGTLIGNDFQAFIADEAERLAAAAESAGLAQ